MIYKTKTGLNGWLIQYSIGQDPGDDKTPPVTDIQIEEVYICYKAGAYIEVEYDMLERYAPDLLEHFRQQIGVVHSKF